MPTYKIPEHLMVEGITPVKQLAASNLHAIQIPAGLCQKKWSYKWCIKGPQVNAAMEEQFLTQGYTVSGWALCKDEEKLPYERSLRSGTVLVLMRRPKKLQEAVNAIYGNISKSITNAEQQGETVSVEGGNQPGMITNKAMQNFEKSDAELEPVYSGSGFNQIPTASRKVRAA